MTVCYWCGAKDTIADIGKELDDGKYKMVQCRKCKNAYYVVNREKMNKPKPQTNEEYLRSCTTEQLAEEIYYLTWFHTELDERLDKNVKNGCYNDDENIKIVMEWLKQPHTIKERKT